MPRLMLPVSPESLVAGVPSSSRVKPGVTAFDAADSGLSPIAFVALTRNEYVVPSASPVTVLDVADASNVVVGCAVVPM